MYNLFFSKVCITSLHQIKSNQLKVLNIFSTTCHATCQGTCLFTTLPWLGLTLRALLLVDKDLGLVRSKRRSFAFRTFSLSRPLFGSATPPSPLRGSGIISSLYVLLSIGSVLSGKSVSKSDLDSISPLEIEFLFFSPFPDRFFLQKMPDLGDSFVLRG